MLSKYGYNPNRILLNYKIPKANLCPLLWAGQTFLFLKLFPPLLDCINFLEQYQSVLYVCRMSRVTIYHVLFTYS